MKSRSRLKMQPCLGAALLLASAIPAAEREPAPGYRRLSVTIDPLLLVIPVYQFTAEYRPVPRWSGALLAGRTPKPTYLSSEATGWEAGAQARFYPWEPKSSEFFGMLEGRYGWSRAERESGAGESEVEPSQSSLATLTVGWKKTFEGGFTFEIQGGLVSWFMRRDGAAWSYEVTNPYANMGLGLSFF